MKNKIVNIYFLILLFPINIASASAILQKFDPAPLKKQITESAKADKVTNVELIENQSFSVSKGDNLIGFIIPLKGKLKEMQSVCMIAWSQDGKKLTNLISTVGFGDWQSVTCAGVNAVGVVSGKESSDIKTGVIYHTMTRFNDSSDYYILGIDEQKKTLFYDKETTDKLESSTAKNISDLRRDVQNTK
ncbi:hypothetical protein ABW286_16670 [Erwinia papayae]|uniref:Uncharacterized protein n=1 Tax=Erwinia papayae TaxID=206499 RepID=A0ABV3N4N8_9GAMM